MKSYKNICIICGKEFIPKRKDSRICSKECLKKFSPKKHLLSKELECVICGKKFKPKTAVQKTCCRECGDKLRLYNYTIKEKPVKIKKVYSKVCPICKKNFETYSHNKKYCSDHCLRLSEKKPAKECSNICVWCGNEFKSKRKAFFCSKSCSNKSRNLNQLHHRPYKINNSKQNKIFRNKIGERDGWVCNICGLNVDKNLNYPDPMSASLDHIIPLSKGGLHIENNVHISHLRCNCVIKQDKIYPR